MDAVARLEAIDEIKQAKAAYFRGVDTSDAELVRGILADDCVLDYMGCCTDPKTGRDYLPAMNVVMRGKASWSAEGFAQMGIVSAHHGHNCEIRFTSDTTAEVIWSMTDRLFMPEGAPYALMTGYGFYHETYAKVGGRWKIKALRIVRTRVEAT
ncbi:nuclear transport factor 2 family protein [Phenylobacterium sp. LjRoot219]|uniref:nuclear transport factor 2 family protein n=1 Tax=Phenylobacterium sp. LjRoot219 TaxID=3342283 RepID=UPI003ECD1E4A